MRHWLDAPVLFGVVVLACACGANKGGTGPFISHDPGPTSAGDGGLSNPDAVVDPYAPVVSIVEPASATDPNSDTVLTSDEQLIRCNVTASHEHGAKDVDPSSVKIEVHWLDKDAKEESQSAPVTAVSDTQFEGKTNLGMLPNGPVRFVCTAKDVGLVTQRMGTASVTTFLDRGPTVEIIEPKEGQTYALGTVAVKFSVKAAPVNSSDTEADPTDIALMVSNMQFDTTTLESGGYTASVNYKDTTLFPMAPSTSQISVTAKSSRTPTAGERSARVNIKLDADGPSVSFVAPNNNQLVRGDVTLQVRITDPSGVDSSKVVGTINRTLFPLTDWKITDNVYSQTFDTRSFPSELSELTINVHAVDLVGNETNSGWSLRLDNVPPTFSLDPPNVREVRRSNNTATCSYSFDPLGDAINDGTITTDHSLRFRAMTHDETNTVSGQRTGYLAGVNAGSVTLFIQRPTQDFLIDSDHDSQHLCDEIEVGQTNVLDHPTIRPLVPLDPRGVAYFPPMDMIDAMEPPVPGYCGYGTDSGPPPGTTLCPNSGGLTRIVPQNVSGSKPPAIYALAPPNSLNGSSGECEGTTWDISGLNFGNGWLCAAVRGEDSIGNVGVSRPLRFCIHDVGDMTPCMGSAPACTSHCTSAPDGSDLYIDPPP